MQPEQPSQGPQCRRIQYRGMVQGVGFRFTAVRIAGRFAVNGFVQNLPDGGVLLVAEGEAAELDRFTAEVAKAMRPYIERVDQEVQPASGAYAGFSIRYH